MSISIRSELLGAAAPLACLAVRLTRTPDIALIARASGFGALYIDLEHSTMPVEAASHICQAARPLGVLALVRVPEIDAGLIGRVLDGGAAGVIVPQIEDAVGARRGIEAARFPPLGKRSWGGLVAQTGYMGPALPHTIAESDRATLLVVMIETRAALANADEIASLDGIDGLMLGASDLTLDMGIPGQVEDPRVSDAIARLGHTCKHHSKLFVLGGIRDNERMFRHGADAGAQIFSLGSDSASTSERGDVASFPLQEGPAGADVK